MTASYNTFSIEAEWRNSVNYLYIFENTMSVQCNYPENVDIKTHTKKIDNMKKQQPYNLSDFNWITWNTAKKKWK